MIFASRDFNILTQHYKHIDAYLHECNIDDYEEEAAKGNDFREAEENARQALQSMSLSMDQLSEGVHVVITYGLSSTSARQSSQLLYLGRLLAQPPLVDALFAALSTHTLPSLASLECMYMCVKSNLSQLLTCPLVRNMLTFSDLAGQLRQGTHYPLFFLCMQHAAQAMPPEWLREQLAQVCLVDMLPQPHHGDERSARERLIQCLDDRELTFVCPMLKLEARMFEVISRQPVDSPNSGNELSEWIEYNVDVDIRASTDFIISLVTW